MIKSIFRHIFPQAFNDRLNGLTLLSEAGDLLVVGQRRGEVVRVEVPARSQVLETDLLAALDRLAATALGLGRVA